MCLWKNSSFVCMYARLFFVLDLVFCPLHCVMVRVVTLSYLQTCVPEVNRHKINFAVNSQ